MDESHRCDSPLAALYRAGTATDAGRIPPGRGPLRHDGGVNRILERASLIMAPVSIAVLLVSVGVLGWGIAESVAFTRDLFDADGWKRDVALPEWLVITSLDDLEAKLRNALVLVLVIRFLEVLAVAEDALDALWYAVAGALVVAYSQLGRSGH